MIKTKYLFVVLTIMMGLACHAPQVSGTVPSCIFAEINRESKDGESTIGKVSEYQFVGRIVYAFEPDTRKIADGATIIKDGNCNTLCSVGGFAGMANGQCIGGNFYKEAIFKRVVWEKK